jgi:hypothetical protein
MAKKVNKPQDISWLKDYDIDALFDMSGVPRGERDLWKLRAELAKKYERKVIEAATAGRDITPYKREFVALITTDPTKYFPEEKWSKKVKISSYQESHHTNNLWRNRNATNGLKSNGAVRDLHLMLEEAKNELGNSLQNGESLSPFAHKGSKTIKAGLPGSVANSAHPDSLTKVVSDFTEPLPKGRAQEIINKTAEEKRRVRTAINSDKAVRDITTDTVDSLTEGRVSDVFNQKKLGISKQDLKIINNNKNLFKKINTHLPTFKQLSIGAGAGLGLTGLGVFGDGQDLIAGTKGYLNKSNSKLKTAAEGLRAMSGGFGLASLKIPPALLPSIAAKLSELHIRNRIKKDKNRYNTTSERLANIPTNLKIRKTLPQDALRSLELK